MKNNGKDNGVIVNFNDDLNLPAAYLYTSATPVLCSAKKIISGDFFHQLIDRFEKHIRTQVYLLPDPDTLYGTQTKVVIGEFLDRFLEGQNLCDFFIKCYYNKRKKLYKTKLEKAILFKLTADWYDFWLEHKRILTVEKDSLDENQAATTIVKQSEGLRTAMHVVYRKIQYGVELKSQRVLRNTSGGVQITSVSTKIPFCSPYDFGEINAVDLYHIDIPTKFDSADKVRTGMCQQIFRENPLPEIAKAIKSRPLDWKMFPVDLAGIQTALFVHRRLWHHGYSTGNLLVPMELDYFKNNPAKVMHFMGIEPALIGNQLSAFYNDKHNKTVASMVSNEIGSDYFGQIKKPAFTAANVGLMSGYWSNDVEFGIHGFAFKITYADNSTKVIVYMGNSGGGKSESDEKLKILLKEEQAYHKTPIVKIETLADDMMRARLVAIQTENGMEWRIVIRTYEHGAFLRITDLTSSTIAQEANRVIPINYNHPNGRYLVPNAVSGINLGWHVVDMFCCVDNYTQIYHSHEALESVCIDTFLRIYAEGKSMKKNTTDDYKLGEMKEFAFYNAFGPTQCRDLAVDRASKMFRADTTSKKAVIRTCLGIAGQEQEGPFRAARGMLDYLKNLYEN